MFPVTDKYLKGCNGETLNNGTNLQFDRSPIAQ
jgi:hypothetical protein